MSELAYSSEVLYGDITVIRNKEVALEEKYIPDNYGTGVNLLGLHFSVRNFIEGIVLGVILFLLNILLFFVIFNINFINNGTKIGFAIMFGGVGLALGIKGFNDEPITVFIKNALDYKKKKRVAYYNPKFKKKYKPYLMEANENVQLLPKEKIMAIYEKYKQKVEKRNESKLLEQQKIHNNYDATRMYFYDDDESIEKPYEYMTKAERKKYDKQKRKAEKYQRKLEKLERKASK